MNLTYTIPESKKDITVKQYLLISKLYKDAEEKGTEVNEYYNQAIKVVSEALNKDSILHLTFDLNGVKYGFINDLENMTAGEYGALDELVKDTDKNAYKILNVLYRPIIKEKFYKSWFNRKKKRGRYLIQPFDASNDVTVFENAPFEIYESALVFFYNLGKDLVSATQNYMSQAEQKQAIEMQTLPENGDGIKHLIHTLRQNELELKKYNINLSVKYYLD